MRRAAIVNPVRTPVGAFGGALRPVPVETLGGIVAKETLKRSGLDPLLRQIRRYRWKLWPVRPTAGCYPANRNVPWRNRRRPLSRASRPFMRPSLKVALGRFR